MNCKPIKLITTLIGLSFLAAGIGGFIPALTPNGLLLGLFEVSTLHNIIHIAFGLAGLAMAKSAANLYLIGGGLIYLATWALGQFGPANLDPIGLNHADNLLHLGAGGGMTLLGVVHSKVCSCSKT